MRGFDRHPPYPFGLAKARRSRTSPPEEGRARPALLSISETVVGRGNPVLPLSEQGEHELANGWEGRMRKPMGGAILLGVRRFIGALHRGRGPQGDSSPFLTGGGCWQPNKVAAPQSGDELPHSEGDGHGPPYPFGLAKARRSRTSPPEGGRSELRLYTGLLRSGATSVGKLTAPPPQAGETVKSANAGSCRSPKGFRNDSEGLARSAYPGHESESKTTLKGLRNIFRNPFWVHALLPNRYQGRRYRANPLRSFRKPFGLEEVFA
jgi:hypothetical protein